MFSKVLSGSTYGIDAYTVEVETHFEKQIPGFTIVGLPDNAVKESRERVTAAIKNSGIEFPLKKSQSILRRQILRKKAVRSICPSNWNFASCRSC